MRLPVCVYAIDTYTDEQILGCFTETNFGRFVKNSIAEEESTELLIVDLYQSPRA